MDTNTVTNTTNTVTTNTTTVATTKVKVKTAGAKLGRKPTDVTEITNKNFTIVDLQAVNQTVKAPTLRAFVARKVETGAYTVVGTQKNGGRGKPANIYSVVKS